MASPIKKKEIVCLTVLMASSLSTSAVFASGKTIAMASSGTLSDKSKSKSESSGQSKLDPMERRIVAQKHFEQGLKAKKTGDTSKALIELLKATREDPRYLEAYYQQAILFRDQSFHKLAASRLEQALAIDPDYQPARILLSTIRLEQGNVTDAIEQLGKTLGIKPSSQIAEANQAPFDHNSKPERISVLQSLHPVLPGTILKQEEKSKIPVDTRDSGTSETHKRSISKHRKKSRTQKNTRQKIRQALAKKYRRFHGRKNKVHQRKPWIARIFKWPEPFRHGIIADDMTGAMDLLPKGSCQPEAVPK
ncbi:MAG: tetratricopeptide repeat protein, partial [Candidatus Obscuribacterales bacterium]|nr:tetratricopeptide repeat protein [Candidatus Obscuribacterales bacterium]